MLPGTKAFTRWATCVYALTACWLIAVLVIAAWPAPGKYPMAAAAWALIAALVLASIKLWIDDFAGFSLAVLALGGLVLWTLAAWGVPKSFILGFLASLTLPFVALLTALRAAGSADDPYGDS